MYRHKSRYDIDRDPDPALGFHRDPDPALDIYTKLDTALWTYTNSTLDINRDTNLDLSRSASCH